MIGTEAGLFDRQEPSKSKGCNLPLAGTPQVKATGAAAGRPLSRQAEAIARKRRGASLEHGNDPFLLPEKKLVYRYGALFLSRSYCAKIAPTVSRVILTPPLWQRATISSRLVW